MDPLAFLAGAAAAAGAGAGWCLHRRARRAEDETDRIRGELAAERYAACHDPLTGLRNRRGFYELGSALVADPARHPLVAVVFDLDDFKQINDVFGHAAGDQVLVTVARRFAAFAGDNLVARLGGDEFAGLLTAPTLDERALGQAAVRLTDTLSAPLRITACVATVTVSVGLAPVDHRTHLADAVHRADMAMYRSKRGRMNMRSFSHVVHPARFAKYAPLRLDQAG